MRTAAGIPGAGLKETAASGGNPALLAICSPTFPASNAGYHVRDTTPGTTDSAHVIAAPHAPPRTTNSTAETGSAARDSVSGVEFNVAATLVHMYAGSRTLNASLLSTTGVSRGNVLDRIRRPMMTQSATILNVAVVHAIATRGLNPTPRCANLPIACAMGASAGTYDASAWKNPPPTSAWGRFQTSTATASAMAHHALEPMRRYHGVASRLMRWSIPGAAGRLSTSSSSSDIAASRSMTSLVLPGGS